MSNSPRGTRSRRTSGKTGEGSDGTKGELVAEYEDSGRVKVNVRIDKREGGRGTTTEQVEIILFPINPE